MKNNTPKRKIFDAVDLLTGDATAQGQPENEVVMIGVDQIRPFRDCPFRMYEGERLADMVESVKEHGVLNPVIVWKHEDGYEMLSGHNRQNAARENGLKDIPAIVKTDLTMEEAYVYVIETNLMQRSFNDLLPSEKAVVMEAHYDKICCQGKRNDIIRELQIMSGKTPAETCGPKDHKLKSRDVIAEEYGFSSRNAARYLRVNHLIQPFKDLLDENRLAMRSAVSLSYLSNEEQQAVCDAADRQKVKLRPPIAEALRKEAGSITEEKADELLRKLRPKEDIKRISIRLKLTEGVCSRYLTGMNLEQMTAVVEQALEAWFAGKE